MGIKIDLGCGKRKKDADFIGLEIRADFNPDIVCDIAKGLPFKDNEVSYAYSCHSLEHLTEDESAFVMSEIIRVCENGASVEILVPLNFPDPAHRQICGYDWVHKIAEPRLRLMKYSVDVIHTTSIRDGEVGKKFSYEQATIVFKVAKEG